MSTPTLDEMIRFLLDLSQHYTRQGLPDAASKLYQSSDALSHQRHMIRQLEAALAQLQRERDEDRRERDALREALKPFADRCRETVYDFDLDTSGVTVRVEHLRRARDLLAEG